MLQSTGFFTLSQGWRRLRVRSPTRTPIVIPKTKYRYYDTSRDLKIKRAWRAHFGLLPYHNLQVLYIALLMHKRIDSISICFLFCEKKKNEKITVDSTLDLNFCLILLWSTMWSYITSRGRKRKGCLLVTYIFLNATNRHFENLLIDSFTRCYNVLPLNVLYPLRTSVEHSILCSLLFSSFIAKRQ